MIQTFWNYTNIKVGKHRYCVTMHCQFKDGFIKQFAIIIDNNFTCGLYDYKSFIGLKTKMIENLVNQNHWFEPVKKHDKMVEKVLEIMELFCVYMEAMRNEFKYGTSKS